MKHNYCLIIASALCFMAALLPYSAAGQELLSPEDGCVYVDAANGSHAGCFLSFLDGEERRLS